MRSARGPERPHAAGSGPGGMDPRGGRAARRSTPPGPQHRVDQAPRTAWTRAPRTAWTTAARGAGDPHRSGPWGCGGGSERWPTGAGNMHPSGGGSMEREALEDGVWDGRSERLPGKDSEVRGIPGLPLKPARSGLAIGSLDVSPARRPCGRLFPADSRALRRPLPRTTLCLSTRDPNKDFFFKQTGSAYGGRTGGETWAGHEAGRRPGCGRRRRR